jgi:hypothetical protein
LPIFFFFFKEYAFRRRHIPACSVQYSPIIHQGAYW